MEQKLAEERLAAEKKADLSAQNEMIITCVKHAIRVGYQDSSCASNYIDTCIRTQSQKEMAGALGISKMLNAVKGVCPNSKSAYANVPGIFDSIVSQLDKP
ncbi:hypothetical protein JWZ98_12025 [Methylomonas sp. EFPC1]|uniref:hypothetical protein n=1 Tax=Methylomonas sp. EFPC1 TaxID=2812647 RepID=UPI0019671216|nr:hypothetical protein [Methylomonas sp. EFPC1]QSA99432.1 hypothetical protein JWZ98_12025 [Methylomonas sp. EFPC1]